MWTSVICPPNYFIVIFLFCHIPGFEHIDRYLKNLWKIERVKFTKWIQERFGQRSANTVTWIIIYLMNFHDLCTIRKPSKYATKWHNFHSKSNVSEKMIKFLFKMRHHRCQTVLVLCIPEKFSLFTSVVPKSMTLLDVNFCNPGLMLIGFSWF